jgi:hypothetical protein
MKPMVKDKNVNIAITYEGDSIRNCPLDGSLLSKFQLFIFLSILTDIKCDKG